MLEPHRIRLFYLKSFKKAANIDEWPEIWRKQFKIRIRQGHFMKLNELRSARAFRYAPEKTIQTLEQDLENHQLAACAN
jgi:hypothetical protein